MMYPDQLSRIYRILWVEEAAQTDYAYWIAPLFIAGCYDIHIAEDTTKAAQLILSKPFDVILVDIRLPPGEDQPWIDLFNSGKSEKYAARLGMALIKSILCIENAPVKLQVPPGWVTRQKIGILSVESRSSLQVDLADVGEIIHQHKSTQVSETILLDLVNKILKQQSVK